MAQSDWLSSLLNTLSQLPNGAVPAAKAPPKAAQTPTKAPQPANTNTLGPIVNNQGSIPLSTTSATAVPVNANSNIPPTYNGVDLYDSENTASENVGQFGSSIWDTLTEWPQVSDAIADAGNSITQDTGQTMSGIVSGFTGNPSTFDPNANPGTQEDQRYAEGLLKKQKAIQDRLKVDPYVPKVVEQAGLYKDPKDTLREETIYAVETAADNATKGFFDGHPLGKMLDAAGGALGELFDDDAVKQALIYYTGARLMGYSASGSGMAAGGVLQSGWKSQAKAKTKAAEVKAAADLKKLEKSQPDMSKTVQMFDKKSRQVVEGNMAPNGDFYFPGTNEAVNAHRAGLVTYKSGYSGHMTNSEITGDLMDTVQKVTDSTLANITDDNFDFGTEARVAFQDGVSGQEMVKATVRSLQNSGVNMNTPNFKTALVATVKKAIQKVAKQGPDENNVIGADLASTVQSMMIKADIRGEGPVPQFVFSRPKSWSSDGKPQGKLADWEMDDAIVSGMMRTANAHTSRYISLNSDGSYASDQKARQKATPSRTIQGLANIFKEKVMTDPEAAKYWRDLSMKDQSGTAFSSWFNSGRAHETKYKGLNNVDILALTNKIYD